MAATSPKKTAVIVIGAPSSSAGKTTVTCGLVAACAARGLAVKCFKTGPDFLDGMQHRAALKAGRRMHHNNNGGEGYDYDQTEINSTGGMQPRTANLDGWMQGSPEAVRSTFARHVYADDGQLPDVCIIEGVMGLHDSRNGTTDDGSSAQIAKILGAPVLLVVDASKCARSVAATALGHASFDPEVRVGGVVANLIAGKKDGAHVTWIREAVESTPHLKDQVTGNQVKFMGGLPRDGECAIPERHLGLHMPEETEVAKIQTQARFERLVRLMEDNLDLDEILELGRTCSTVPPYSPPSSPVPSPLAHDGKPKCRIGIAEDAAFCFYYADNLHLLAQAGAELVPFSPLADKRLPPNLDGLYFGGGYPELHAAALEENAGMRSDIKSFCESGATVFAECGGLIYLAESIIAVGKEDPKHYEMCGVFPGLVTRMTKRCTMYYATIEITRENPVFGKIGVGCNADDDAQIMCRGQEFHYSEVVTEDGDEEVQPPSCSSPPVIITPERPGARPTPGGYVHKNTFASYLHFFFASKSTGNEGMGEDTKPGTLADDFVRSTIRNSPSRTARSVSFVSAATEIIFALGEESSLAAVTSVCDYPPDAQRSPRRVICRSTIDASSMTSEEVTAAVEQLKQARQQAVQAGGAGPPGNWTIDIEALTDIAPNVVFVQNTCAICDVASDDAHYALKEADLFDHCSIIPVAPTTIEEMFQSIRDIGLALNVEDRSTTLLSELQSRLGDLASKLQSQSGRRPRVLSLEGLAPLCTGGGWLPDIKNHAGCEDAFGEVPGCSPKLRTWLEIEDADPDVLLISPCSASPSRTMNELHLLALAPEFWNLRCVQNGCVYVLDHKLFSRPGPRLIDGCELLAALLRGVEFDAGTTKQWEGIAFKYQCSVDTSNTSTTHHCTKATMNELLEKETCRCDSIHASGQHCHQPKMKSSTTTV